MQKRRIAGLGCIMRDREAVARTCACRAARKRARAPSCRPLRTAPPSARTFYPATSVCRCAASLLPGLVDVCPRCADLPRWLRKT
eukprot:4972458-Pleurochrysis_carterae.AAC.1